MDRAPKSNEEKINYARMHCQKPKYNNLIYNNLKLLNETVLFYLKANEWDKHRKKQATATSSVRADDGHQNKSLKK